jgi:hypothetical protein
MDSPYCLFFLRFIQMRWTGRFEGYNAAAFRKDLISGLIVGIIAIASGVKSEYRIYTTIIAGILIYIQSVRIIYIFLLHSSIPLVRLLCSCPLKIM